MTELENNCAILHTENEKPKRSPPWSIEVQKKNADIIHNRSEHPKKSDDKDKNEPSL